MRSVRSGARVSSLRTSSARATRTAGQDLNDLDRLSHAWRLGALIACLPACGVNRRQAMKAPSAIGRQVAQAGCGTPPRGPPPTACFAVAAASSPPRPMETEGRSQGPPPQGQISRLEARLVLEAALEARFPRLCVKKPIIGGNTLGARVAGRKRQRGVWRLFSAPANHSRKAAAFTPFSTTPAPLQISTKYTSSFFAPEVIEESSRTRSGIG